MSSVSSKSVIGPIEAALAVGGTAVAIPLAKDMLTRLLGPSAEILGDRLKENLISVIGKTESMAAEAGVELKQIPARTGVPILEAARLEDDEWMQERWATLIFNAANPNSSLCVRPAFVDILKNLSPQDAKFLYQLFKIPPEGSDPFYYSLEQVRTIFSEIAAPADEPVYIPEFDVSLQNLVRLGLIWADRQFVAPLVDSDPYRFSRTPLSDAFMLICSRPDRSVED